MITKNIDLEKVKEIVRPYFIKVYGEEYREIVVKRIKAFYPIIVDSMSCKEKEFNELLDQKRIELSIEFLRGMGIFIPDELAHDAKERQTTLDIARLIPEARVLLKSVFETYKYSIGGYYEIDELLNSLSNNEDPKLDVILSNRSLFSCLGIEVDAQGIFSDKDAIDKIRTLKGFLKKLNDEFEAFADSIKGKYGSFLESSKIKRKIELANYIEFLNSIREFIAEPDLIILDHINSMLPLKNEDYIEIKHLVSQLQITQIATFSFTLKSCLEAFTEESEKKLRGEIPTTDLIRDSIKKDREFYFETVGLCAKENATEYLKSKKLEDNRPSEELIHRVLDQKAKYGKKCESDFIKATTSFAELEDFLKELKINNPEETAMMIIKNNHACQCVGTKVENGNPTLLPIIFLLSINIPYSYYDMISNHEFNHAIELSFLELNSKGNIVYKTGFDVIEDNITTTMPNGKRRWEILNEAFNELIAQEVTDAMHADGIYIFDEPGLGKTKRDTIYQACIPFISDMWALFRPLIIAARVGNLNTLTDIVSYENFEEMNEIVNDFYTLTQERTEDDYVDPESTANMRRAELMKRSKTCTEAMKAHAIKMGYDFGKMETKQI